MNFFKTSFFNDFKISDVLSLAQEEPDEADATSASPEDDGKTEETANESSSSSDAEIAQPEENREIAWNFGGLVKSIAEKSEGMLQAYRKDLEEFGSGLKKETQIIAHVAAHAVKDLPTSLESGASIAQESIESVGQVIEDFSSSVWRGTTDIIAQGKDAVLRLEDESQAGVAAGVSSSLSNSGRYHSVPVTLSGGKYSRFEAQVRSMQHDSSTYCDEPEDAGDYAAWKSTFSYPDKKQDIQLLLLENTFLEELFTRFVPDVVDEEAFWTRYFYKLHKLKQTEEARENLVKRATALEEDELTWDIEEDEIEEVAIVDDSEEKLKSSDHSLTKPSEVAVSEISEIEKVVDTTETSADGSNVEQVKVRLDKKESTDEEDDLGWEVAEGAEESSSKRSSNSEASWDVPEVPKEEIKRRIIVTQEQDEEDLSWDVDDGEDDGK